MCASDSSILTDDWQHIKASTSCPAPYDIFVGETGIKIILMLISKAETFINFIIVHCILSGTLYNQEDLLTVPQLFCGIYTFWLGWFYIIIIIIIKQELYSANNIKGDHTVTIHCKTRGEEGSAYESLQSRGEGYAQSCLFFLYSLFSVLC